MECVNAGTQSQNLPKARQASHHPAASPEVMIWRWQIIAFSLFYRQCSSLLPYGEPAKSEVTSGIRYLRLRRACVKGLPCLAGPCLSLGSSHFVLLILQPAQEESKDKVEMLEEGEGMGERHIPFLHLPVSLVVWRIP